MIDFRYHLVSLVAVFLALAAGIVLGSGPMRSALVSELTNETDELRELLAEAEAETARTQEEGALGEEFVDQASDVLLGQSLAEQDVAIIRVHDPDGAEITGIRTRVVSAGGTVTANLTILPAWTDDDQAAFRGAFAAQVSPNVVGVDSTVAPSTVLAHALAQAMVPTDVPAGTAQTDLPDLASAEERSRVLLGLLRDADLVSGTVNGEIDVILWVQGDGPDDIELFALESGTLTEVVGIVDEYAEHSVVATGTPRAGGIPEVIQSSALLRDRVSTVTDAMNHYGQFTVALAMAYEISGEPGHYGYGEDQEIFPGAPPTASN